MTVDQVIVFAVILLTLILPMFRRWRYDLVAVLGLLVLTILGIISADEAFAGYGHPAVITVAAVLVCSRGLENSGVVDLLARWISSVGDRLSLQLAALCGLAAIASAFMNNVGALAVFLPVAIRMAQKGERSPAVFLMPLAFSAHFGGMMTLIGTPPNIIIGTMREQYVGQPLGMFDFAPVGLSIAFFCIIFMALVGWRLIPERKGGASTKSLFTIEEYFSQVRVPSDSRLAGQPVRELEEVTDADVLIVGIVRGDEHLPTPSGLELIQPGDDLLVRANAKNLRLFLHEARLDLAESQPIAADVLESPDIGTLEAVVRPDSILVGKTARELHLRQRFSVNLLAVSRRGAWFRRPVGTIELRAGDVMLLQSRRDMISETLEGLGALPLARRDIKLEQPRHLLLSIGIFGTMIVAAATGLLPVQVTMTLAACAMLVAGLLTLHEAYESIDWPVIILLGAMLPLGLALETTGGAQLIADQILQLSRVLPPAAMLAAVLVGTMFLSDIVKNAAAVVLMAPIAIGVAQGLGVAIDPFLVAVAIAGSCAFLTPIGHQSNVMVLEPGGYEFGDYWRLGLPLEVIITLVAVPLLLILWPL